MAEMQMQKNATYMDEYRNRPRDAAPEAQADAPPDDDASPSRFDPELLEACKSTALEIKRLKKERSEINEQINALKQGLVARGLNQHAVADALRYWWMEEDNRDGYDNSSRIMRAALGVPILPALFEDAPPDPAPAGEH